MPIQYNNNSKLKRPNQKLRLTQEQCLEFIEAGKSVLTFAERYYYIVHPIDGQKLITLHDYQIRILQALQEHRFIVLLAARQVGKTTCSAIYMLWFAIFNRNKTVAILANKADIAKSILDEIKLAYEELPKHIQPGLKEYNAFNIKFDNGSEIIAKATSKDALRGLSVSLLMLDEFAFVASSIADEFWASNYPTISTGGSIIVVSTPNGTGNLFYDLWRQAEQQQNSFTPIQVNWWEVPGRDENWKEETIKNIGKIRFNAEYGCRFEGSSTTLIDADFMTKHLIKKEPISTPDDWTKWWSKPEQGHHYLISVDVCNGVGSDYSVANVFDVTDFPDNPATQVCCYRRNDLNVPQFTQVVYEMCRCWNDAYLIIETNANLGEEMLNRLLDEPYEYENFFVDYDRSKFGVYSTRGNKPVACAWFKELLENKQIILNDEQVINELSYFEEVRPKIFQAKKSKNCFDDVVMTCVWLACCLKSSFFEDLQDTWENYDGSEDYDENDMNQIDRDAYEVWQNVLRNDEEENDDWLNKDVNPGQRPPGDVVWW
jgi:hypothetical protein